MSDKKLEIILPNVIFEIEILANKHVSFAAKIPDIAVNKCDNKYLFTNCVIINNKDAKSLSEFLYKEYLGELN